MPVRSGTRSDSDRVLWIFGFSDGEIQNPFGLFYTSDQAQIQVISDITELCDIS